MLSGKRCGNDSNRRAEGGEIVLNIFIRKLYKKAIMKSELTNEISNGSKTTPAKIFFNS